MKGDQGTTPSHQNFGHGHGVAPSNKDGGALFVLESKGNWKHAGFHLSTSIVAPALLSLPYAMKGLGWAPGILALIIGAAVSFYAYTLMSRVLEQAELEGHRLLRFRDVGQYALGRKWGFYPVAVIQMLLCVGTVIGCIILGGESMKVIVRMPIQFHSVIAMKIEFEITSGNLTGPDCEIWLGIHCLQLIYNIFHPARSMQLFEFTIIFGIVTMALSQLPSFHSLRYINLVSLLCSLGYSLCAVGGSIYAGHAGKAPAASYAVVGSPVAKTFGVFYSLVIIATTYGNGIIPEIQATLAPPVTGKMFKGLLVCYAVVLSTFFTVAIAGYWAFGNEAQGNIFLNLEPFVPKWLNFLSNILVIAQLLAVCLVYAQPTFEIFEGRSSDVEKGKFAARNLVPRLFLRTGFVAFATLVAAALPFFGDINAIIGAFGFTPLDFVLPFILFAVTFRISPRTFNYWLHRIIIVIFILVGLLGCIASVRQVALDASSYKLFANVI